MRGLDPRIHLPGKRIVARTQSLIAKWMDARGRSSRVTEAEAGTGSMNEMEF
jgi:hypothetical protein